MAHQCLADAVAAAGQQRKHAGRQAALGGRLHHGAADEFGRARVRGMCLEHDRAAGCQCRRGVAAGHREGEREIAGGEDGHRAAADHAHAQVGPRRLTLGQGRVDAHVSPGTFAQERREQAQLSDRARAFAFEARARQAGFLHGAFDQCVAERQDLFRDRLKEHRALIVRRHAERVECRLREAARLVDLRCVDRVKRGFEFDAGSRIECADRRALAQDGRAADQCLSRDFHNDFTFA